MVEMKANRQEIEKLINLLKTETNRSHAAAQLGRIGVRTRGARSMTRGSLQQSAEPRIQGMDLTPAYEAMRDQRPSVRREVAFALGEWADESSVGILIALAAGDRSDPDPEVRGEVADALGKIGGAIAVSTLQSLALNDPDENVRSRVIGVLGSLANKAQPDSTRTHRAGVRTRGLVRATAAGTGVEAKAGDVFKLLRSIQASDISPYVREVAEETLAQLGE
jgi:HEAT repeat protein